MIILEYIWLDANNKFRSKIKVVKDDESNPTLYHSAIENVPTWNYDGSSTGQAKGLDTEVILKPVFKCPNPFLPENLIGYLVLCETFDTKNQPLPNNYRYHAKKIFDSNLDLKPWYGFEQEYFILNPETKLPFGFESGDPEAQGKYYCGVGFDKAFGRKIMLKHLEKCLKANLTISGTNAEVAPSQWEYQIGPVEGIDAGDQLQVSRYILERVAEEEKVLIELHPKPLKTGDWNGSGCHTNFSTKLMREGNGEMSGLDYIMHCIGNLEKSKEITKTIYGEHNDERLTGKHETSSQDSFSYGIGTRHTSIRIGNETKLNNQGYMEDRRPASNVDPYLVSSYLVSNC
jgi:glutamine synthetase